VSGHEPRRSDGGSLVARNQSCDAVAKPFGRGHAPLASLFDLLDATRKRIDKIDCFQAVGLLSFNWQGV
jgi:hypothetical protein